MLGVYTGFNALRKFHLFFSAEKSSLSDAVQIHTNQIGGRIGVIASAAPLVPWLTFQFVILNIGTLHESASWIFKWTR